MGYLKIIKHHVCLVKRKTPTELPKLKLNKVLNTRNGANIMRIIPTLPRVNLPRFHQMILDIDMDIDHFF